MPANVGDAALQEEIERLRAELEAERRRLRDDLAFAHRVQLNLMPRAAPDLPGWEVATAYQPAREVGGDFFDLYTLPQRPSTLGFVVADVTGKGMTAALMMAFTRAILRSAAYNGSGPADALQRTNRVLVRDARTGLFVTAFAGWLDTSTGVLRWASAGHEAPLVIRAASGRIVRLRSAGELLGMFDRLSVHDRTTRLERGDCLVVYTDGVTDARSSGGEFFGDRGLVDSLRTGATVDANDAVRRVETAVAAFAMDAPAADDLTVLAVSRAASSRSP